MIRRLIVALCGLFVVLSIAPYAWAVLTTDNTNIGTHPSYGSSYSAFWRTGLDYAVLEDANNTYVNAPSAAGTVYLRAANSDIAQVNSIGITMIRGAIRNASQVNTVNGTLSTYMYGGGLEVLRNGGSMFSVDETGNLTINGNAYKPGGGSWASTSDIRTKRDVVSFTRGLDVLRDVRPIEFAYNGAAGTTDDGHRYVGVSAQELARIAPSMVSSRRAKLHASDASEVDVEQVDPSAFTYELINAVKELDARVKQLESRGCH